jgi:hypothetical protein
MEVVANEAFGLPGFFPWVSDEFEMVVEQEKNSESSPNVRYFKATLPGSGPGYPYRGEGPLTGILINNEIHLTGGGTVMIVKFIPGNPFRFEGYLHHVYEHEGGDDDAFNPHTSYFTMEKVN